ncbi:hypothetical protein GKE82_09105 [Conexibacter sp. W3-3-2]|nr:hypothetical protein [Conexibacter sp. W3-3-2]
MLHEAMALAPSVHRFTSAEYDALISAGALDGLRVELLDGLILDVPDMSPQGDLHVGTVRAFTRLLAARADLLVVQSTFAAAEGDMPEPDLMLASTPQLARPTAGLLVVEVAVSSRGHDLAKAAAYARADVARYWVADARAREVVEHTDPTPGGYRSVTTLRGADVLDAHVDGVPPTTVAAVLPG